MNVSDRAIRKPVSAAQVLHIGADGARRTPDRLVTEEPMEIRAHGPGEEPAPVVVTMRTPGNDFELAAGFLHTEGLLADANALDTIAYCLGGEGEQMYNVVTVKARLPIVANLRERNFMSTASCGICGKTALEDVEVRCAPVGAGPSVTADVIRALPSTLTEHQRVFGETGGLHAAARFSPDGSLLALREDVGRHNALDKLVGHAFLERALPLAEQVLLVSGRLSFELVQKAAVAGIPVICAVSAPSNLAVAAAERFGQTVVGFLRDDHFNVYCHPDRVLV